MLEEKQNLLSQTLKKLEYISAGITHYLQGIVTTRTGCEPQNYYGKFTSGIEAQINILKSILENLEDTLFNLESEIHFGIFKSEIDVAKELKKIN